MKGSVRMARKMARSGSLPAIDRFIMNCSYFDAAQKNELYSLALFDELASMTHLQTIERHSTAYGIRTF